MTQSKLIYDPASAVGYSRWSSEAFLSLCDLGTLWSGTYLSFALLLMWLKKWLLISHEKTTTASVIIFHFLSHIVYINICLFQLKSTMFLVQSQFLYYNNSNLHFISEWTQCQGIKIALMTWLKAHCLFLVSINKHQSVHFLVFPLSVEWLFPWTSNYWKNTPILCPF